MFSNPHSANKASNLLFMFDILHQLTNGLPSSKRYNIAIENGPFENVFLIEHGDIPLLC